MNLLFLILNVHEQRDQKRLDFLISFDENFWTKKKGSFFFFFLIIIKKVEMRSMCTFPKCPLPSTAISRKSWRVSGPFLCLLVEIDTFTVKHQEFVHWAARLCHSLQLPSHYTSFQNKSVISKITSKSIRNLQVFYTEWWETHQPNFG